MQPFPHPNYATHKIWSRLANWFQRYSNSNVWNFRHSKQVTPKWVVWFSPKSNLTKLLCLPCLPATLIIIRTKMNELACRHHFPIVSLWEIFFRRSRAANSIVSSPIWLKFELIRDFMHFLITCKYKKDRIKSNREKVETPFSPL